MLACSELQDILNTIVCSDCFAFVKDIPDKCVNCVVTSVPYWQQRDYGVSGQIGLEETFEEYIDILVSLFRETRRTLRKDGSLWINIGDTFNENSGGYFDNKNNDAPKIGKYRIKTDKYQEKYPRRSLLLIPYRFAIAMIDDGWLCRNVVIWKKKIVQPTTAKNRFTIDYEPFFLFTQKPAYYFNTKAKWINNIEVDCFSTPQRSERRSVWNLSSDHKNKNSHAAPYPVELAQIPIEASCPDGGIVLDMFMGSGSSAAAAKRQGVNFLGSDISEKSCKMARKRLAEI